MNLVHLPGVLDGHGLDLGMQLLELGLLCLQRGRSRLLVFLLVALQVRQLQLQSIELLLLQGIRNGEPVAVFRFGVEFASLLDELGADGLVLLEQYLLVLFHFCKLHRRFLLSLMQHLLQIVSCMLDLG